ncbi:predicted protein [Naegleria gruberi]|uniref:Predicted protein n=1 Tax=Naegleria gruberi TaxID=5762 RepID=D2UYB0_NAEGR|nr:uncharacterized protein NAEGRDRAFT_29146 [Naegleria gruberi]EFC50762.1 predicted protein [Naegleria gruberi]|eukprot:XP_002683506.1 predicted protein [Naegleria gruberi strain NEG-M]
MINVSYCIGLEDLLKIKPSTYVFGSDQILEDANCTIASIEQNNNEKIFPILKELVSKQFFKIFKVDLSSPCPFWAMKKVCTGKGGCSVCECDENEIPISWKKSTPILTDKVNKFLGLSSQGKKVQKWQDEDIDCWTKKEGDGAKLTYINLLRNPETRTGYSGEEASRVWNAIYGVNCFVNRNLNDMCFEERVFYKLISGLHISITMKIARYYTLKFGHDENPTYDSYTPNYEMFEKAILPFPDRVKNLYFLYTFTLRALQKAAPFLKSYNFNTENEMEDLETSALMSKLLENKMCGIAFDEKQMFKSEEMADLRTQMKASFRNISSIMDCVACEKCKMWAKLDVLGLATALKINLDGDHVFHTLQRNEIVALINSFKQHSQSIYNYHEMITYHNRKQYAPLIAVVYGAIVGIAVLLLGVSFFRKQKPEENKEKKD